EASLLGIKPKSALLLITRITYDQHGSPCEFSRDQFRGDRTRLAVTVQGHGVGIQSAVDTASVALQKQEVRTKASWRHGFGSRPLRPQPAGRSAYRQSA